MENPVLAVSTEAAYNIKTPAVILIETLAHVNMPEMPELCGQHSWSSQLTANGKSTTTTGTTTTTTTARRRRRRKHLNTSSTIFYGRMTEISFNACGSRISVRS